MRILQFNSTNKEVEISISGWTRVGYISREIKLTSDSYGESSFDHNYSFIIKQIADFELVQDEVNGSLSTLKVLSYNNKNVFPNEGKVLGTATIEKIENKKERDIVYLWSKIYLHQDLFESIEKSLSISEKFRVTIGGLKYFEEVSNDEDKKRYSQKFTITNVNFENINN